MVGKAGVNGLEDTRKEFEKEHGGGCWDTSGGRPEVVAEEVVVVATVADVVDVAVEQADMGEAVWLHRYSPAWASYETTWSCLWWTPGWICGGCS